MYTSAVKENKNQGSVSENEIRKFGTALFVTDPSVKTRK